MEQETKGKYVRHTLVGSIKFSRWLPAYVLYMHPVLSMSTWFLFDNFTHLSSCFC